MKFLLDLNHLTSNTTNKSMNSTDGAKELKRIKSVKLLLYIFTKAICSISIAKNAMTIN